MYTIQTMNNISEKGLELLREQGFTIHKKSENPDGLVLRSAVLDVPKDSLIAIARSGVGVNNIPLELCTEKGIVVFNTPGANANSVKELVINGMFLSSRKILEATNWLRSLPIRDASSDNTNFDTLVEQGKKEFAGPEILGKKLSVLGLGSIGAIVANAAVDLGMQVFGYDPYISVDSAWGLSSRITRVKDLISAVSDCDFLSLHIPLQKETKGVINSELIAKMKTGVRILNFARGGLVNDDDMLKALRAKKVARYVTDFPNQKLLQNEQVLATPHLGASTPEAEENCAIMACKQLSDFLRYGQIKNSANFPSLYMQCSSDTRLVVLNKNVPAVVGKMTSILARENINISDMINKHRENVAITIIDIDGDIPDRIIELLRDIRGVIRVRKIAGNARTIV